MATYTYDYRHLRTRKDLGIAGTTVYHYDLQGRLILETDVAGNAGVAYVWDDIAPIAQLTGTTISYLHTDHLHTPRLATDASQAVVWRNEGTAFGNPVAGPVSSTPTPAVSVNLRFPGQYYDAESGLHCNWNRYYDPKIGRYITSDPVGLDGGLNTYVYVYDNPLRWIDPEGLKKKPDAPQGATEIRCWEETVSNCDVFSSVKGFLNCLDMRKNKNMLLKRVCCKYSYPQPCPRTEVVCGETFGPPTGGGVQG